jgi:hypothetical protein
MWFQVMTLAVVAAVLRKSGGWPGAETPDCRVGRG